MRIPDNDIRRPAGRGEAGFALILALLALMLLTFLGLTLSTQTSTELRIATNYRWSQQALYNAEAGIELAKRYLQQEDWQTVLPQARPDDPTPTAQPPLPPENAGGRPDLDGNPSRDFELFDCDTWGGAVGYGRVLDDPNWAAPYMNTSVFLGQTLNGTFTVWIRRPFGDFDGDGDLEDNQLNNTAIVTAEGTAPFTTAVTGTIGGGGGAGGGVGQFAYINRAVRVIEVELGYVDPNDCENRISQSGSGPGGANYDGCDPIRSEGILGGVAEDTSVR